MNDEATIGDTTPEPTALDLPEEAVATILDFDELLNAARLVERTATICLRGDLEAELEKTLDELASMVDATGEVLGSDQPLYDAKIEKARALDERATEIRAEMAKYQRSIRFQAMPDDEYRAFVKEHCYDNGTPKKQIEYQNKLISRCAIEPRLTEEQLTQMRSKIGVQQMNRLFVRANEACTTGGLDVPKSLSFLAAPNQ